MSADPPIRLRLATRLRRSPDFTELTIDLEVYDLKHLSAIIAQLRAKAVVARVERVNG